MPRNFYRRVEVMFPVESPPLKRQILNQIVPVYLSDNVRARRLQSDGSYNSVEPRKGETRVRSQTELLSSEALLMPRPMTVKDSNDKPNGKTRSKSRKKTRAK